MKVPAGPALFVGKDPGGLNGVLPVYEKYLAMGMNAVFIANGKAVELLTTNSPKKINFRTFASAADVLREFPNPSVLVTSMCSLNGGNLGHDLIPLLKGICPTIGLNDYHGASLGWPIVNRPEHIIVNDEVGADCVRRAWQLGVDDEYRIQKLGYPALDAFSNLDKAKLRQEAGIELGISEDEKVVFFCGGGTHTGKEMQVVVAALNIAHDVTEMSFTLVPREHPRMRNNYLEEVPEWDVALNCYKGGRLIVGSSVAKIKIEKLLARADLMINDFSTVAIAASVLRIPNISYFDKDLEACFKESTVGLMEVPPVVSLGCSAMATSCFELLQLIKKNFTVGLGLEEAQRNTFKVDGKNAERVAEFVAGLIRRSSCG